MFRLIIIIVANALGIYVATRIVPGFEFTGTYFQLAIAAVIFAVINRLVLPIVRFVSGPLIFITLGLFSIIVNMAMLWLLDLFIPSLVILNLTTLLLATLLIGFINLIFVPIKKSKK